MKKAFRVLIVDDNEELIADFKERISRDEKSFNGQEYYVDLVPIHIDIAIENNISRISTRTLQELDSVCKKPFMVIFADFGYVRKEVDESLVGNSFTREELKGKVLTTADLAEAAITHPSNNNALIKNLVNTNAKFYLYSYISEKYFEAFRGMYEREILTRNFFRQCRFSSLDTRDIFFGETFRSKYDKEYYSHLIGRYIDRVIKHEFAEFILEESKRQKIHWVKQIGAIVGVATLVGLAGEFLGAQVFKHFEKGELISGILFGFLGILFLVFVGWLVMTNIEKWIEKHTSSESDRVSSQD